MFYKIFKGEAPLNPIISQPDMKTKYPIQITDLRFRVDHITPKKKQFFEEYRSAPDNARLFVIAIRRKELEYISDRNKLTEVRVL